MKDSNSTNSQRSADSAAVPQDMGFSPWQRLKSKRISYLTLPLILMATVVEFVILATGWKYQQVVCVPRGMGVMFLGIGPIGATILAVELLKLPLAIWTASRVGWQKVFMLIFSQRDSVLARAFILFERVLKVGLDFGLPRRQVGKLALAIRFLFLDDRQFAIELGDFDFFCGRLLQKFAGRFHRGAHFVDRHVLDQLERQHTNQRQTHD